MSAEVSPLCHCQYLHAGRGSNVGENPESCYYAHSQIDVAAAARMQSFPTNLGCVIRPIHAVLEFT